MVYCPGNTGKKQMRLRLQPGVDYRGEWYDPRTGESETIAVDGVDQDGLWASPKARDARDWVLVVAAVDERVDH